MLTEQETVMSDKINKEEKSMIERVSETVKNMLRKIKDMFEALINKIMRGSKDALIQFECMMKAMYQTLKDSNQRKEFRLFFNLNHDRVLHQQYQYEVQVAEAHAYVEDIQKAFASL